MSDSESIAQSKTASRFFPLMMLFGGLLAAATFTMKPMDFAHHAVSHRPIYVPMLRPLTESDAPSAYDVESGMSSAQLLNRWDAFIGEASQRFHIPKAWIRAVMSRESGGRTMLADDKPIVSRAGAVGLMQVMPGTYEEMAGQHKLGANPFDAHDNILAGAAYLRWLHKRYGYPKMFAAYNAGPGRVAQGGKLPAETRAYVGNITRVLTARADLVHLTRPDGRVVKIDVDKVTGIRAAHPGEFAAGVKTVVTLGRHKQQGIRENVSIAISVIRDSGGLI